MTNTKIVEIDSSKIEIGDNIEVDKLKACSEILKNGGTVAFPTETVYGLGANGLDPAAITKIFKAKGRPSDNPLILHVASIDGVKPLVKEVSQLAQRLMELFWPGPLTLVIEKSEIVPDEVTAGLDTVAIRMPQHGIAQNLIKGAGVPIAAPSANLSGRPSPTSPQHVIEDLRGKVDAIVISGNSNVGVESTVLDLTVNIPTILRPGGVTKEMLEKVIPVVAIDPAIEGEGNLLAPKSPGMKYTHYAPKAKVFVVRGLKNTRAISQEIIHMTNSLMEEGKKVGIIATEETKGAYTEGLVYSIGSRENLDEIAANLFKVLREFDETDVEIILAEAVEESGLGKAIMNRLLKAAGYRIIEVK